MTGLEALAIVVPRSGRGLTAEDIAQCLAERGVVLPPGRLELILDYLLRGEMVTRKDGRYKQIDKRRLDKVE